MTIFVIFKCWAPMDSRFNTSQSCVPTVVKRRAVSQPLLCISHREPLKYVCVDCRKAICADCKDFGKHKGHRHDLLSNTIKAECKELNVAKGNLNQANRWLEERVHLIDTAVERMSVASPAASATQTIENHFRQLWQVLEARKQDLIQKDHDTRTSQISLLQKTKERHVELQNSIQAAMPRVQAALDVRIPAPGHDFFVKAKETPA